MATDTEVAWAAGLFEGEGCCTISKGRQPRVELGSTDEDVVRRFAAIVGRGNVRHYEQIDPTRKDVWQWSVQSQGDVLHVLNLLWAFFCDRRRERAYEVIERASKMGEPRNLGDYRQRTGFCKRGHDLSDDSEHLYVHAKTGKRHCRTCRQQYRREWKSRPLAN